MGRSKTRPDPRPSYAQELNYTGVFWHKGGTPNQSPYWQSKLTGKPTLYRKVADCGIGKEMGLLTWRR